MKAVIDSPIPQELKENIKEPRITGQLLKLLDTTFSHTFGGKIIARTFPNDRLYCQV